jgi:hypothetical protein
MSILNHVWGVSREKDRVWAQVAGMGPDNYSVERRKIFSGIFPADVLGHMEVVAPLRVNPAKFSS